ncbi:MAG: (Fe-S)-binding protein [Candidatus Aenigmarchaeota archaeon]|nr:(Fe-S)-binding protein [Candidatus Aenigmarchaeota archaeon]MDW8149691.1 (Fe-S)-binding protein [Candidatus Aenigmarchaeota archaeon]
MIKIFGNILFYPGCIIKLILKDFEKKYEKILKKYGIDFIKLSELEFCCGSPALNAGYFEVFKSIVDKNMKIFKEHSIKKIITPCPACFKTFKIEYPKFTKFNIEVEHITQTIWKKIKDDKSKKEIGRKTKVTYHDPCHLGRYCKVYDEPRKIIESLGYKLSEMKFSHQNSFCCGGGGGVAANFPLLAEEIAKERISQALKTGAKILITSCPLCYIQLEKASKRKIKVMDISSLF